MEYDVVCFSHLRWDFVYQRPQHLLTRCAGSHRTIFVEEAEFAGGPPALKIQELPLGITVVTPQVPANSRGLEVRRTQSRLLNQFLRQRHVQDYVLWYYTPMAVWIYSGLESLLTVYDCMDELSAFARAPSGILDAERELLNQCDLAFAGGRSLFEAKRKLHPSVYEFPSCVDLDHFRSARSIQSDPIDQAQIPHPRLGFYGVIDERLDSSLIQQVATEHPDWHFVLVGPIFDSKVARETLPHGRNVHYLGPQEYKELPLYLSGWDVALLPFARNESTRYISPTKTPEYLAAGKRVVSTAIQDVVHPYGDEGFVSIADSPEDFGAAIQRCLDGSNDLDCERVDFFLSDRSWDRTWAEMEALIRARLENRNGSPYQARNTNKHLGQASAGASLPKRLEVA